MNIPFQRLLTSALAGAALAAAVAGAAVAQYPDKPITVIVPFAPGSAVELVARVITEPLAKKLGQPFIITAKPGADGMLGTQQLATARPDGYTIMFTAGSATTGPALRRNVPFDPVKQIQAVAEIGSSPYVVVVNSKLAASSIRELIDLAKKTTRKLNAATAGTSTRLSASLFALQAGVEVEYVPFTGTSQASVSVMTGETDFAIMDRAIYEPMVQAGQVRLLAVVSDSRLPDMPDLPTMREAGMPDYSAGSIFGVYTTGGVPDAVLTRLNSEINQIVVAPETVKTLKSMGLEAARRNLSAAEFTKIYLADLARMKDTVVRAGIPMAD